MDYSEYKELVSDKLEEYGTSCTVTRKGSGEVYDPTTDSYTGTSVTITAKAFMSTYDIKFVNGTSILAGDVNFMMWCESAPQNGDVITFGNKKYNIINVNPFSPDGTVDIYYDVQGRA